MIKTDRLRRYNRKFYIGAMLPPVEYVWGNPLERIDYQIDETEEMIRTQLCDDVREEFLHSRRPDFKGVFNAN